MRGGGGDTGSVGTKNKFLQFSIELSYVSRGGAVGEESRGKGGWKLRG